MKEKLAFAEPDGSEGLAVIDVSGATRSIVKDRLDSLATTSSRVFEDTATPLQAADALPALVIEPLSPEKVESNSSLPPVGGIPLVKQKRTLRIGVTGIALTRAVADQIALEVEQAMWEPFAENALGPRLDSTDFDVKLGEKRLFAVQLVYLATYYTAANDPGAGL